MQRKTRRTRGTHGKTRGGKHYTKRQISRTPRNSPSRNPPALSPTTLARILRIAAAHRSQIEEQRARTRMLEHQARELRLTPSNNPTNDNSPDVMSMLGLSFSEPRPRPTTRFRRTSPN